MSLATLQHFRALGYCNRGIRASLKSKGVEWSYFLDNGLDSEWLRSTGNPMAIKVADLADSDPNIKSKTTNDPCEGCK